MKKLFLLFYVHIIPMEIPYELIQYPKHYIIDTRQPKYLEEILPAEVWFHITQHLPKYTPGWCYLTSHSNIESRDLDILAERIKNKLIDQSTDHSDFMKRINNLHAFKTANNIHFNKKIKEIITYKIKHNLSTYDRILTAHEEEVSEFLRQKVSFLQSLAPFDANHLGNITLNFTCYCNAHRTINLTNEAKNHLTRFFETCDQDTALKTSRSFRQLYLEADYLHHEAVKNKKKSLLLTFLCGASLLATISASLTTVLTHHPFYSYGFDMVGGLLILYNCYRTPFYVEQAFITRHTYDWKEVTRLLSLRAKEEYERELEQELV